MSYTWLDTNINLLYLDTRSLVKKDEREKIIYIILLEQMNETIVNVGMSNCKIFVVVIK